MPDATAVACSVTNSIATPVPDATSAQDGWDGSIVVISGFTPSGAPLEQGYEQTLSLLPLQSGAQTLAPGATDALELTEAAYNLILAQSNNLYPALMQGELESLSQTFPPITVQTTDSSSCANALTFFQNIAAFPTSSLATGFTAACNSATNGATGTQSIEQAMDAYFATTKQFTNVSFAGYVAAMTYVTTFANAWANFQQSYTYYLYKGSGAPAGSSSEAAAEGTVTFTQTPPSGVPDPTDTSGGYTIVYENGGSSTTLYFNQGQLVSSTTEDVPAICLPCSYAQLSQFTGSAADAGTLVPVILGNANGVKVIGIDEPEPSPSLLQNLDNFFKSQGFQVVMGFFGLLMAGEFVVKGLSALYRKMTATEQANGGPPTQEQAEQNVADVQQELAEGQQGQQDIANRVGEDAPPVPDPAALPEAQANAQGAAEEQQVQAQAEGDEEALQAQAGELQQELDFENNQQIQQVAQDEQNEQGEIESVLDNPSVPPATGEQALQSAESTMEPDTATVSEINTELGSQESQAQQEQAELDEAAQEAEEEEAEEEEQAEEDTEEGDDPFEDGE